MPFVLFRCAKAVPQHSILCIDRFLNPGPVNCKPLPAQAGLLLVLEEHLYAGEHEEVAVEMYPAYLVLLTSGLGAAVTARLSATGRLAPLASWPLHCIFVSKVAMLLVPRVSERGRHLI